MTRSRSIPLCISRLELHERYVSSSQFTFVRVIKFYNFIVSSEYLLVAARNAQAKHANNLIMGRD